MGSFFRQMSRITSTSTRVPEHRHTTQLHLLCGRWLIVLPPLALVVLHAAKLMYFMYTCLRVDKTANIQKIAINLQQTSHLKITFFTWRYDIYNVQLHRKEFPLPKDYDGFAATLAAVMVDWALPAVVD